MKIVFQSNQLSLQGTEIALYDYAYFNQKILGNESVVVFEKNNPHNKAEVIRKFEKEFPTVGYEKFSEVDGIVCEHQADLLYCIKSGKKDGKISRLVPTMVHAVFPAAITQVHGAAYAFVSDWLSMTCSDYKVPAVPHMVHFPPLREGVARDLRVELGIDDDATVFACYGGSRSFDIPFVRQQVIPQVLGKKSDVYFVFLNIEKFIDHPRVIFLPGSSDVEYKMRFINTSDAMLHARQGGESFGMACAEFSILNKPIFAYAKSRDKNHLMVLGERGFIYTHTNDLVQMLVDFDREDAAKKEWDCYSQRFSPERVMELFDQYLIKEALRNGIVSTPRLEIGIKDSIRSRLKMLQIKLKQRM
jgi:hypothetical protein